MKHLLIALLLVSSIYSVNAQQKNNIEILSLTDFKAQTENKEVQIIDVRTPEEFNDGHIANALNINFYIEDFNDKFNKLNKETPIYLYCRSGVRSHQSAVKLSEMGFKTIYDLEGGFLNYNNKNQVQHQ